MPRQEALLSLCATRTQFEGVQAEGSFCGPERQSQGPEEARKRSSSLGEEASSDAKPAASEEELEPLDDQPLRQDLAEVGLSALASEADAGASRGHNTTDGSIGWHREGTDVVVLLDTGSDLSFISRTALAKLQDDHRLISCPPMQVRLNNGTKIVCDQAVNVGLTLSTFKARTQLIVLDWDAYDIILGMGWLKKHEAKWDLGQSAILVRGGNSRKPTSVIPLRPFCSIDRGQAAEEGFDLMDYKAAARAVRKYQSQQLRQSLNAIQVAASKPKDSSTQEGLKSVDRTRKKKGKSKEGASDSDDDGPRSRPTLVIVRDKSESAPTKSKPDLPSCPPQFTGLLQKYRHVFREELPQAKPKQRGVQHDIDTGDSKPINVPYYPLSRQHRDEQDAQIRSLLEKGLIRPSSSAWGFPVLFVPKGSGWRMCIDYRLLNNVTKKDGYPLPRIQDCLDSIGKAKFVSKVDLTSGYWQIEVNEHSIPKTAFNTRSGKYEFLTMPFGLTNAPATFQRIMNEALRDLTHRYVIVYLDDIVVYSDTAEDHFNHLEEVFRRLDKVGLYAKPSKCTIGASELEFCGHVVGNGQCRPLADKIAMIASWPQPRNVHEVRQFLGLASYYRRFIRGFAQIAAPLSDLLVESDEKLRKQKFRAIRWNARSAHAFNELKRKMSSEPVLRQIDDSKRFRIETDCSEWALGCVLLQEDEDGKWHPVAFDGRKLNGAELNYPIHEKELLAIKHSLRTWGAYISNGTRTEVLTDHESLKYLQTTRTPSKRLARWIDEFSEFDLDIRYRKGSEAIVPDAISRRPDFLGKGAANKAWVPEGGFATTTQLSTLQSSPLDDDYLWESAMCQYARTQDLMQVDKDLRDLIRNDKDKDSFRYIDERLYKEVEGKYLAPFVASPFRDRFISYYHDEYGHFSGGSMLGVCRARGWWRSMEKDITRYAQQCSTCQHYQRRRKHGEEPNHQVRINARPFEKWAIDLVGPLPTTLHGNRWIITAIDFATGWPLAKAVPDATAEQIGDFLFEIYTTYGAFTELLSDNGANLTAEMIEWYLNRIGTRHRYTTAYHPQTNGKVERFNGVLGATLSKLLIDKPIVAWDEVLQSALFACRIKAHTESKISPFKLVYGLEPRIRGTDDILGVSNVDADFESRFETMHTARHAANKLLLERAIRSQKLRTTHLKASDLSFEEGSWVLLENPAKHKLHATYLGPFRVLRKRFFGTYALETDDGRVLKKLVHGSRLIQLNAPTDNVKTMMVSAFRRVQGKIEKSNTIPREPLREASEEVVRLLDEYEEELPPTYRELSLMSKKDFELREKEGRLSGDRKSQVGGGMSSNQQIEQAQKEDLLFGNAVIADRKQREKLLRKQKPSAVTSRPSKQKANGPVVDIDTAMPPAAEQEVAIPAPSAIDEAKVVEPSSPIRADYSDRETQEVGKGKGKSNPSHDKGLGQSRLRPAELEHGEDAEGTPTMSRPRRRKGQVRKAPDEQSKQQVLSKGLSHSKERNEKRNVSAPPQVRERQGGDRSLRKNPRAKVRFDE